MEKHLKSCRLFMRIYMNHLLEVSFTRTIELLSGFLSLMFGTDSLFFESTRLEVKINQVDSTRLM